MDPDLEFARKLQAQFDKEAHVEMSPYLPPSYRSPQKQKLSVVSNDWETIDPTPDLHALFIEFNQTFFWGKLLSCEVRWSPRMTTCAGICRYSPRERFCTIGISIPLLKLRPRKDLVETLLHEMIHAYLFITDNNDDHDGHGPEFHKHMYRINQATGANISVYHTFHDEVALYKQHWWRCSGPCTRRPPFYGFVKRAMNRAPGPTDRWWMQHQNTCGGSFTKAKEPEGYGKKKGKENVKNPKLPGQKDIRSLFGSTAAKQPSKSGSSFGTKTTSPRKSAKPIGKSVKSPTKGLGKGHFSPRKNVNTTGSIKSPAKGGGRGNIFGFGGTSFKSPGSSGSLKTAGKAGTYVVKPGWKTNDNSSGGTALNDNTSKESGITASESQPNISSSSSGAILGGSTPSSLSAREMARLKWANGMPGSVSNPSNSRVKSVIKSSDSNKTRFRSTSDAQSDARTTVTSDAATSSQDLACCPVCGKNVPAKTINQHLDECLIKQGEDKNVESLNEVEDVFDDDDDELLLKAADEFDRSVIEVPESDDDDPLAKGSGMDEVPESDDESKPGGSAEISDDDEPLIKGSGMDESMNQDDLDLLAAFNDVRDDYNEEFACPVCQKLVSNLAMNSHLNQCLQ